ncbi:hypothetical protein RHGRI_022185 [Rhododendron griersonianum]|uniref:FAR1 domain-containing protein n=1 Tax=Rhododendron griersonianum TaxID=479676 RepID=A0AAV6JMX1_9ERIC|nr:hypothetical protein RHGRI_022185 [Rhododendron griersonianum]
MEKSDRMLCWNSLAGNLNPVRNLWTLFDSFLQCKGMQYLSKPPRRVDISLGCDRGGCYRNKWHVPMERRQRNTATRLINCPFEIRCKRLDDRLWVLEVKNGSHNHEPSSDMAGHPSFRRFSKEEIMTIEELTRSGVPPRQILSSLRLRNKKLQAVSRTIYNMKNKLQRENLAGRTTIQALFDELCEGDFTFKVAYDQK